MGAPLRHVAGAASREEVLTVGDYLSAYVIERTLHHLDLIAHLPSVAELPAETLGGTGVAGEDRRDTVSHLALRHGRDADGHRTSHPER